MVDFNTAPYFDDFDENKKFLKVLYRPGYAVQTRELNQAQTILQNQVDRVGRHLFQEGAMVIPGNLSINDNIAYVKCIEDVTITSTTYTNGSAGTPTTIATSTAIANLLDKTAIGQTSGVEGVIRWYKTQETIGNVTTPLTLYVEYDKNGTADSDGLNASEVFSANEILSVKITEIDDTNYTEYTFRTQASSATGNAAIASIASGIYYVKGFMALVEPQTIILSPFTPTPTYRVGLQVVESVVTPEADSSLADNAAGTYNQSAPGAHRYKIELLLKAIANDSTDTTDFIELIQVEDGLKKKHVVSTQYSELEKTLARRTYDESGDYTVSPFRMRATEARDNNRGGWKANTVYYIGDIVTYGSNTYQAVGVVTKLQDDAGVEYNAGESGTTPPTWGEGEINLKDGPTGIEWLWTSTPNYNGGHKTTGQETKFTLAVDAGKAYIRGYEIEKPATTFIQMDKARETRQVTDDLIRTTIGNYVLVKDITGIPDIANLVSVNILGSLPITNNSTGAVGTIRPTIGTANIKGLEKDGNNYRLYLFNVKLNDGIILDKHARVISNASFESTLVNTIASDNVGSVTKAGSDLEVVGVGTRFNIDYAVGDQFEFADGTTFEVWKVESDTSLSLTASTGASAYTATGVAYKQVRHTIADPSKLLSVFPLGKPFIKSVKDANDEYNLTYTVMQKSDTKSTTNNVTYIDIALTDATLAEGNTGQGSELDPNLIEGNTEVLVCTASGAIAAPTNIEVTSNTTMRISGLELNTTYTVFFPVQKQSSRATPKTKTLTRFATVTFLDSDITRTKLSLGKADIYQVRKVEMATGPSLFAESGATDVTNYFTFDDGQRDGFYDVGTITRKNGFPDPTGALRVTFDYFQHSGDGDFFSIDSYDNLLPEDIPFYSSATYGMLPLADLMDFRPRISDDGLAFNGAGSSRSAAPKPGTSTEVDYSYYIPRTDKVYMDIEGVFGVARGVASERPQAPNIPAATLHMATIEVPPYTFNPKNVKIKKIDNRRYTMRDIGALEKRLDNLEYYTSLSLLEQKASGLAIPDADTGLDRFKNGFIVDNFAGHMTGNVTDTDYKASIDMSLNELRPSFTMDNIKLIEKNDRDTGNYQVTGDLITLPYTENALISQLQASKAENVNPFAIFTFIGTTYLNPPSDEWIETQRLPDIVNDIEGNYSAVAAAARDQLGTIWNSWQTQWTGTSVITGTIGFKPHSNSYISGDDTNGVLTNALNELAKGRRNTMARQQTLEINAQTAYQTRTGTNTEIKATFQKELINDKLISSSVIPFIRSRAVSFLARGMKLQTRVYSFFDDVDVSQYVTPFSRISFSGLDPVNDPENIDKFDFETQVGEDSDEKARRYGAADNTEQAFNKGDILYVKERNGVVYSGPDTSIATAVVTLQEVQPGGTTRSVLVANVKGTFAVTDKIAGSISGSQGLITALDMKSAGDPIFTNFGGDCGGVFRIPNTDALKFPTGNREFKLIDNTTNNDLTAKTRGFGNYRSEGTLQTFQATYNSIRNAELVRTTVTDDRTIVTDQQISRIMRDTGWWDPLAQTFLIQNKGGAFITSIDVWFASVDPVKPVTLQIRDVVNGYPGKNILPFSNVTLQPYELRDENQPVGYGLSSNTIQLTNPTTGEQNTWLAPDKPTKFKMQAPVFVQDVGEYCIVIASNSNNYNVWISELGGIDVAATNASLISEQPYAGVLFKSQNASTWTAHQNEDLMFRINTALFDDSGTVTFTNAKTDKVYLNENPFFTRGLSKLVRVTQYNHGFNVGDQVAIDGVATTTYNGIDSTLLNGVHSVLHVTQDTYVIRVNNQASATGFTGGSGIYATRNIKFDTVQPIIAYQNFADTSLNFAVKAMSAASISGAETPGVMPATYSEIEVNEANAFVSPRMVASVDNEYLYNSGNKSFELVATMSTNNNSISPVIDTARLSAITVNNKVNSPTVSNTNFDGLVTDGAFDTVSLITPSNIISFDAETQSLTASGSNTDQVAKFRSLKAGTYIEISGADETSNNGTFRFDSISDDGATLYLTASGNPIVDEAAGVDIAISHYTNFVDETAAGGSADAKYMTKKINLDASGGDSRNLNIRFAADIPPGSNVDVYYKTDIVSSATDFRDVPWVLHATATPTNGYADQEFDVVGLEVFDVVSVKLVMRSTNSSFVPTCKDLIVVATA